MADPPTVLDKVHIRDLLARCIVGVRPDERKGKQDVLINITLEADLRQACRSDRLEDTIDYARISRDVADLVAGSSFSLVERLAEAIADVCLEDKRIQRVRVQVEKPGALSAAWSAGVEIVRRRRDAGQVQPG